MEINVAFSTPSHNKGLAGIVDNLYFVSHYLFAFLDEARDGKTSTLRRERGERGEERRERLEESLICHNLGSLLVCRVTTKESVFAWNHSNALH